jgi:hypothetical protein
VKVKPVELVLERAEGVRRVGSGWMVSCPLSGHGRGFGDRKPSESVFWSAVMSSSRITYAPRGDTSAKLEAFILANIYALALQKHKEKNEASRPGSPEDVKGRSQNGFHASEYSTR